MNPKNKDLPISITLIIIFILLFLDWNTFTHRSHPFFDLNNEQNLPTWFSTVLLFSVTIFSLLAQITSKTSPPKVFAYYWGILSIAYLYFSMDEMIGFHEISGLLFYSTPINKFYHWYYLYLPFTFFLFLYTILYFRLVPQTERGISKWIIGGMLVTAAGAAGLEVIWDIYRLIASERIIRLLILAEETLEMTGAAMILQGCWLKFYDSLSLVNNPIQNDT